jgi:type I restriction enzyme S subunit
MSTRGWVSTKWGEISSLEYGKSLKGYKDSIGDIPVYGTNGLIGYTNKPLCLFPSVIIGRKGAFRGVHYSQKPFFVIDTAFYLQPKNHELDLKFAYYQLLTQDINSMDSGSAIPSTSREDFYNLELKLPPLKVQQKIVEILSSIDEKIELNRQTNVTLEAIAQAIFKEWFVNFNFPGATGEMVESEMGPIPKGWNVGSIADILILSNETMAPGKKPDTIFKHFSIPAFDNDRIPSLELGSSILSNKFRVRSNSILVSKLNPRIPRIWAVKETDYEKSICSTEFQVLIPKKNHYYSFAANLFAQESIIEIMKSRASGTSGSHQRINPNDILNIQIVIPENNTMSLFEEVVGNYFHYIINSIEESTSLAIIRDSLLPKLMNGEIEV